MANYLDDVIDRIHAVVCQGRGTDGSLGSDSQTRSIAAAQFRRPANDASLRDPQYPGGDFDTAVNIEWNGAKDEPEVSNELDPSALTIERFTLLVGYLYGASSSGLIKTRGSEVAATCAANWRRRAMNDAKRIKQALCWHGLVSGDLSNGVRLIGIRRQGESTPEDIGEGRGLSVTTYEITLNAPRGSSYNP